MAEQPPPYHYQRTIGKERAQFSTGPTSSHQWICSLDIEAGGQKHTGTGFKIHYPDVNLGVVVTSAHCVYVNGAYASQITVMFSGKEPITVKGSSSTLYAAPEYVHNRDPDFDYGLILVHGEDSEGLGWSTQLNDGELSGCAVSWIQGGQITSTTNNRLYMSDTGCHSGSPVCAWYHGNWTVVGVHSDDKESPYSAVRFSLEIISRFAKKITFKKTIESAHFRNVFLRMDAGRVTSWDGSGSGTVNCQYGPPKTYEQFYIYPIEMPPSPAKPEMPKVVVESARWENVFLRMDGNDVHTFTGPGAGQVNCQLGPAQAWEMFYLKKEEKRDHNQFYSFIGSTFTQCRLRLDGAYVNKFTGRGGGTVNCQYCESMSELSKPYEKFIIHDI